MGVSAAIDRAIRIAFGPEHYEAVRGDLAAVPSGGGYEAEWIQAATLALTFGDRDMFDQNVMSARIEPRDIAYALESPEVAKAGLTRAELVRRYRAMGLEPPERIVDP